MNNHKITNLATPTVATDAATKGYVDSNSAYSICYSLCDITSNTANCASGYTTITRADLANAPTSQDVYSEYYYLPICNGAPSFWLTRKYWSSHTPSTLGRVTMCGTLDCNNETSSHPWSIGICCK